MRRIHLIAWSCALVVIVMATPLWARKPIAPTPRAVEHNNRGAKLLSEGAVERAEQELKTAVELSPDYAEAYNNLGIVYKKRELLDLALQHFQKAVDLNPDYASAYNHIAAVYITRGQYDLALKNIDRALKKEPAFADAVYQKGLAYYLQGQGEADVNKKKSLYAEAERQFSKATQLNPKLTLAHKNMGDLYTEQGQYEQAAIRYRLALEDQPNATEVWEQLANVYRLMGETAKAQNASARARDVARLGKAQASMAAGLKALADGEFNGAIKHFAQALLDDPKSADAAYHLGLAYQRQKQMVMARQAWQRAIGLQPDHAAALYNLGTAEGLAGEMTAAVEHLCRFLAIGAPQFPAEAQAVRTYLREQGLACRR